MGQDTDADADRSRNSKGRYNDRIPPEAVLDVFDAREDQSRPLTAGDVVDELDIARRTAHNKLTALVERGVLETRKVGARGRVWWTPDTADSPGGTGAESVREEGETPPRPDAGPPDTSTSAPASAPGDSLDPDAVDAAVTAAVDDVADGWTGTDARLDARKAAARAVLQHAVDTGDVVGKSDATGRFLPEYAVDGQNAETWWRKNIRPVLREYGDYNQAHHGYVVAEIGDQDGDREA